MSAERLTAGAMLAALALTSWARPPLNMLFSVLTLVAAAAFLLAWMRVPDEPEEEDDTVIYLLGEPDDAHRL